MSLVVSQTSPAARVGEAALWGLAGVVMLTLHVGTAVYLMQENTDTVVEGSPPAAIMIELAAEPEAANTEEEQISPDLQDAKEVASEETQPVEEPQPEPTPEPVAEPVPEPVEEIPQEIVEPTPEPVEQPPEEIAEPVPEPIEQPQEVAETPPEPAPPEPVIEEPPPEPEPEIAQPLPELPPEPIEPIQEQATAVLENVEVPLPTMRPLPPIVEKPPEEKKPEPKKVERKKPEPRKEPVKKVVRQQQAQQDMAEARIQAKQSERTAATQTSTGFFSSSVSPAQWMTRVRTKIARYARKCPGGGRGIVTVRFSFDGSGNITSASVSRSSGDAEIDNHIVSAVQKSSPIPTPPSGVASHLTQPVTCQ